VRVQSAAIIHKDVADFLLVFEALYFRRERRLLLRKFLHVIPYGLGHAKD
jgi:hypothetical protein